MHPQSLPLSIDGTVPKEFYDLEILAVTFDSNMTFEKHIRSVSRAAFSKTWYLEEVLREHSMIDRFLGDDFIMY